MAQSTRAACTRLLRCGVAASAVLLSSSMSLASQAASFATSIEGHDHQPGGWLDYAISGVGAVIVAVVIFYTIKWFVRPSETSEDHIKRKILEERG